MDDDLRRHAERSIGPMTDAEALDHIGSLIDRSLDAGAKRGLDRALRQLDELAGRPLAPADGAVLEYFRANAYSALDRLDGGRRSWDWEREHLRSEILALARAASHPGFGELGVVRQCQIITNRANSLNTAGRFVDALEGWDQALSLIPNFAMAHGNRASALEHYARSLYDPGHQLLFLLHAHDAAASGSRDDAFHDSGRSPDVVAAFAEMARRTAGMVGPGPLRDRQDLEAFSLGKGARERAYRAWCLRERLFVNPLNDLGAHAIAAQDVLTLPSLVLDASDASGARPPRAVGLFNQLKQEFVSARWSLYEGLTTEGVHFSDRGVLLYDTLDYPSYSLATERVRTAFRTAYSLLDKVAFFVDAYWTLQKKPAHLSFRTVWYKEGRKALLDRFGGYPNWPLRGLFWLSKELFDDDLKGSTGADARELHELRNRLEHRYLQVHAGWAWPALSHAGQGAGTGESISDDDLAAKAIRVMKLARSALIYLSLAVAREEELRHADRPEGLIGSMPLWTLDDDRKRTI